MLLPDSIPSEYRHSTDDVELHEDGLFPSVSPLEPSFLLEKKGPHLIFVTP